MIGRGPKRPPLLESAPQARIVLFRGRNLKHKALTNLRKQLVWQSLLIYLLLGKALPRLPATAMTKELPSVRTIAQHASVRSRTSRTLSSSSTDERKE